MGVAEENYLFNLKTNDFVVSYDYAVAVFSNLLNGYNKWYFSFLLILN